MKKSKLLVAVLGALCAMPVFAADAPAKPDIPTLGDVLDASGISINGYLDTAYSKLLGTGAFTSGTANRVFDTEPDSFNLHQAAIMLAKQPKEGFGGLVNLTLGKDAGSIKSYGQTSNDFDVTQAFMQYAGGSVTVIAGKFVTASGAEVINSTVNTNYSRSILFGYAIPFTHTGLRATYAVNDQLSFFAGVNNGWDQAKDSNKQKTGELGIAFTPNKAFILNVVAYSGYEQVSNFTDPVGGQRNLFDIVATYIVNDNLNFVLNYDSGSQENATPTGSAKWNGLAAYANYQISEKWLMSLRAESFKDVDGYRTGVTQEWREATLTLGYMPTKSVQLRGEIRKDTSDNATFAYSDTIARKDQSSLGLEAIYKF